MSRVSRISRGEARGFLSDKFRRLDARPLLEAFTRVAADIGAVPIEGYALDTKVTVKAILPNLYEPVPNEIMAFGLAWSNSDFGDGAHSIRIFMLRLWCTNFAIGEEALRQVHLGARLSDDIAFSERTMRLDTMTSASMLKDVVRFQLSEAKIESTCNAIRKANDEHVGKGEIRAFLDRTLTKGDRDLVEAAFSSADVENLPAGQTKWRLSNAISWVAGKEADEAKRLDMMRLAGQAIGGV